MTKALIGIDIGTQGTKTALFSEDGACLASAFSPSHLHRPAAGVVEEDPEVQYTSVLETIADCVRQSGVDPAQVAGLAIDGQMAGVIGIGADGRHVTPYDSWLDTRCAPYITQMLAAGDEVLIKSGGAPGFNHGPKILWWMHEHPATYSTVRAFVQPGGYAAMRLCGLDAADAFIDTTYLHFSGFADTAHARWDAGLCAQFGVSQRYSPAHCRSGDRHRPGDARRRRRAAGCARARRWSPAVAIPRPVSSPAAPPARASAWMSPARPPSLPVPRQRFNRIRSTVCLAAGAPPRPVSGTHMPILMAAA